MNHKLRGSLLSLAKSPTLPRVPITIPSGNFLPRASTAEPPTDDTKIFFWKKPLTIACNVNASISPFQKLE